MLEIIFDIETDGLKPNNIWCIVAKPLGKRSVSFGPDKIKEGIALLNNADPILIDNIKFVKKSIN